MAFSFSQPLTDSVLGLFNHFLLCGSLFLYLTRKHVQNQLPSSLLLLSDFCKVRHSPVEGWTTGIFGRGGRWSSQWLLGRATCHTLALSGAASPKDRAHIILSPNSSQSVLHAQASPASHSLVSLGAQAISFSPSSLPIFSLPLSWTGSSILSGLISTPSTTPSHLPAIAQSWRSQPSSSPCSHWEMNSHHSDISLQSPHHGKPMKVLSLKVTRSKFILWRNHCCNRVGEELERKDAGKWGLFFLFLNTAVMIKTPPLIHSWHIPSSSLKFPQSLLSPAHVPVFLPSRTRSLDSRSKFKHSLLVLCVNLEKLFNLSELQFYNPLMTMTFNKKVLD